MSSAKLFKSDCVFIMGVAEPEGIPASRKPEIAFAGRSNVGKSTLINALTGKRKLAHASSTPGRTQQINFFLLADTLMLVDLPGYGYAKAARTERHTWQDLIAAYLMNRANLKRVCLLIDARRGIGETDQPMMELLDEAAVSYQIVLTKTDKLKPAELAKVLEEAQEAIKRHPAAHPQIITTSALKSDGIEHLRRELALTA